jgi:hypothetical protein
MTASHTALTYRARLVRVLREACIRRGRGRPLGECRARKRSWRGQSLLSGCGKAGGSRVMVKGRWGVAEEFRLLMGR